MTGCDKVRRKEIKAVGERERKTGEKKWDLMHPDWWSPSSAVRRTTLSTLTLLTFNECMTLRKSCIWRGLSDCTFLGVYVHTEWQYLTWVKQQYQITHCFSGWWLTTLGQFRFSHFAFCYDNMNILALVLSCVATCTHLIWNKTLKWFLSTIWPILNHILGNSLCIHIT